MIYESDFCEILKRKMSKCVVSGCPTRKKEISCKESGKGIKYNVSPQEVVCLFVVDSSHNGNCKLRKKVDCLSVSNPCDFILFVEFLESGKRKRTVVFVELKGNKIMDALFQIKKTASTFFQKFQRNKWKYRPRAVIVFGGRASPHKTKNNNLKKWLEKNMDSTFIKRGGVIEITSWVKE